MTPLPRRDRALLDRTRAESRTSFQPYELLARSLISRPWLRRHSKVSWWDVGGLAIRRVDEVEGDGMGIGKVNL